MNPHHPYDFHWHADPNIALICAYIAADAYVPASAPRPAFITAGNWHIIEPKRDTPSELTGEYLYKSYLQYFRSDRLIKMMVEANPSNTLQDFFARCYVNSGTDELMIAYRGTIGLGNASADAQIGINRWTGGWSTYDEAALAFYEYVIKNFQKPPKFPAPVWITGHSLGGYLAQVVASHNPGHTVAITFNSPGIGGLRDHLDIHSYFVRDHDTNIFNVNTSSQDPVHYTGGYLVGEDYNFPRERACRSRYIPDHPIDYGMCEHAIQTVLAQAQKYPNLEQKISQAANTAYQQELNSIK